MVFYLLKKGSSFTIFSVKLIIEIKKFSCVKIKMFELISSGTCAQIIEAVFKLLSYFVGISRHFQVVNSK